MPLSLGRAAVASGPGKEDSMLDDVLPGSQAGSIVRGPPSLLRVCAVHRLSPFSSFTQYYGFFPYTRQQGSTMRYSLWQRGVLFLFLFLLPCFSLTGNVAEADTAQAQSCLSVGWPHESSDLKPDPGLVFGRLANGLRYVLKTNATPKNRVAMYLNVQAGSLHETRKSTGARPLSWNTCCSNGTTHYPPGTLGGVLSSPLAWGLAVIPMPTPVLMKRCITCYCLQTVSRRSIAEGFKVLADYAREALLLESGGRSGAWRDPGGKAEP